MAICDARGSAHAALSISAILDRLNDERVRFLADLLRKEVAEIERKAALVNQLEFGG